MSIKQYDHTAEYKERVRKWREHHIKVSQPDLYDLGMRIKNGPHTDTQIARATNLSVATIRKLRNMNHGGTPYHSTIKLLQQFFRSSK